MVPFGHRLLLSTRGVLVALPARLTVNVSQANKGFDGSIKAAAVNAPIASCFQFRHPWRRVTEQRR